MCRKILKIGDKAEGVNNKDERPGRRSSGDGRHKHKKKGSVGCVRALVSSYDMGPNPTTPITPMLDDNPLSPGTPTVDVASMDDVDVINNFSGLPNSVGSNDEASFDLKFDKVLFPPAFLLLSLYSSVFSSLPLLSISFILFFPLLFRSSPFPLFSSFHFVYFSPHRFLLFADPASVFGDRKGNLHARLRLSQQESAEVRLFFYHPPHGQFIELQSSRVHKKILICGAPEQET